MSNRYSIGLDYGTNSVRALVVDVRNGHEVGTSALTNGWKICRSDIRATRRKKAVWRVPYV